MTRHLYVQGILAGNGARSSSTALQVITPLGGTHYLGDKNRFDVSSKGPSSGIRIIHTSSRLNGLCSKRRICFYRWPRSLRIQSVSRRATKKF